MEKTKELYYESAYIKEFDAVVTGCRKVKDGIYEVTLDQTAFFPEQGGQTSDKGVLMDESGSAFAVSHVSITNDSEIRHTVDCELAAGSRVHGVIDWEHRFSNMQQHTGEHIFSGIVSSRYGFDNVGFHLSDCEVTMDYNGVLSQEDIAEIEMQINRAIWENVEVICEFPDEAKLTATEYRSKKKLSGAVRLVTVKGYDVCACCAPHVSRTGEIGLLKVIGLQNYKGGVRVSILCGERALRHTLLQQEIVRSLSLFFTTSEDRLISSVKKLSEENVCLKAELTAAKDELISYEAAGVDAGKKDVFLCKPKGTDQNTLRKLANELAKSHEGFCGVFAGSDGEGYRYIICSGAGGKDAKVLQERLEGNFEAKGGGNAQMIQGSINGADFGDILAACKEA